MNKKIIFKAKIWFGRKEVKNIIKNGYIYEVSEDNFLYVYKEE